MSYLQDIKEEVQNFAEVISQALHVETEIIDENWDVIGATSGMFQDPLVEWNDTNSKITRHIFNTKRALILADPGKNHLCSDCTEKENCYYKAGLYYPILLKGKVYGVISLVAFDEEQQQSLMKSKVSFMRFTSKMADLLASKIKERLMMEEVTRTNEYLNTIITSVHEGIIACDNAGRITCFNDTAEKKLGISKNEAIGSHIRQIVPNSLLLTALHKEISLSEQSIDYKSRSGQSLSLVSNVTLVSKDGKILGAVESFNTDENLFRIAQKLMGAEEASSFKEIIGTSQVMRDVKARANRVAKGPSTVLITGESGTGKELFARAIHNASQRADKPFVAVNCSAIPDNLLESELFGYDTGAFTGAKAGGKPGIFEMTEGGTIFLDEIGDMPANLQVKLLRVLQERVIQHVGGVNLIPVDVRVIAATNKNLLEQIALGEFREDLYYRINVIPLTIPPLRERPSDIPLLVNYMCSKYAAILNKEIRGVSLDAVRLLESYSWPGNVRELENAIEYAINYTENGNAITKSSLPHWLISEDKRASEALNGEKGAKKMLAEMEKSQIEALLNAYGTDLEGKKKASAEMGVSLATFYRKLKKYGLS